MEDMFLKKKGTLVCEVQVNAPGVDKVQWLDKDENSLINNSETNDPTSKSTIKLLLDITYEEWTTGIKRVCRVEHKNLLQPVSEVYERKIGKKILYAYIL